MSRLTIFVVLAALIAALGTAWAGTWPWPAHDAASTGFESDDATDDSTSDVEADGSKITVEAGSKSTPLATKHTESPSREAVRLSKVPVAGGTHFRLPDGMWAPGLNGVLNAPPMQWPSDLAWSPIRRKIVDREGKEWYEHVDGSYSNTDMLYRSDLGKKEAVTNVFNPKKVRPLDNLPKQEPPNAPPKK